MDPNNNNGNIRNRKGGVTTGAANSPDPISAVQPQPQSDKDNYDGSKSKKNAVKPNSKQLQAEVLNERMNDWIDDLIDGWFRYDTKHVWIMVALTLLSFTTRFWHIGKADFVVWDEAHFGKNKYCQTKFNDSN